MNTWHKGTPALQWALIAMDAFGFWLLYRWLGGTFEMSQRVPMFTYVLGLQLAISWTYWFLWSRSQTGGEEAPRKPLTVLLVLSSVGLSVFLKGVSELGAMYALLATMAVYRYQRIIQRQPDVGFRLISRQRKRHLWIALILFLTWMSHITDFLSLGISLGAYGLYFLFEAYWINTYKWWQATVDLNSVSDVLVMCTHEMASFEKSNRRHAVGILAIGTGAGALALFMGQLKPFYALFNLIRKVAIFSLGLVARPILALFPKMDSETALSGQTAIHGQNSFVQALRYKQGSGLSAQPVYEAMAWLLVASVLIALGFGFYKVLKRRPHKGLEMTEKLVTGIVSQLTGHQELIIKHKKKPADKYVEPQEAVRRAFRALMQQLETEGIVIEAGDTLSDVKAKLRGQYPHQLGQVEIVAKAYMAQRYGNQAPDNMTEVLEAFEQLKGGNVC